MLSYRAPHGVVRGRDIACARSDSARSRVLNSWLARGSFFGLAKGSGRRVARRSSSEGTPIDPESKEPADIVVADTVVDGKPAAVPASGRTDNIDAISILKGLVGIVKDNGRALISIYVVTEAVNFLANRAFHRLTNQIAMTMLAIPQQAIGNVWWLSQNPDLLANGSTYQALTASVFLIAFPVSVLIKAFQSAYFYHALCPGRGGRKEAGDAGDGIPRPENAFRPALSWVRSQFRSIGVMVPSLFTVELLVSLVVIPLQFASLLVVSLPFTLPIIMSLHVALPVAINQKIKGWKAIQASRELMKPIRWKAAIPFVFIIVVQRLIDLGQGKIISSLPSRFYYELLEIPVGVLIIGFSLSVIASVMRASLPFLLFNMLEDQGVEVGAGTEGSESPDISGAPPLAS